MAMMNTPSSTWNTIKDVWSDLDNKVMYEIDSKMTNMIEGKLTIDSQQMIKFLLNMGMAWLRSIEFNGIDTHPPMQLTVGLFLDNSNNVRRLKESAGLEDKWITQVLKCICITMFKSNYVLV